MYLSFYGLKKEPFQITPDPEFLFLSPSHKEAMGSIIYGVEQRKGFVSIIGEVGTGKTTIIRSYLERADRGRVKPIYLFHANITFAELLKTIFREMGRKPESDAVYDMISELQEVLIEEYRKDHNIVLIIDEAQNMPTETFEQLRMLSNLETTTQKLIQIILVGQPELEDRLGRIELRQLKQRLAIRAVIKPLTPQESLEYIQHRLSRVSTSPEPIFSSRALEKIIEHAGGAPRMLNILCDNALIAGYGFQQRPVTPKVVKMVIRDFEGSARQEMGTQGRRGWRYAAAALALALTGTGAYAMLTFGGFSWMNGTTGRQDAPAMGGQVSASTAPRPEDGGPALRAGISQQPEPSVSAPAQSRRPQAASPQGSVRSAVPSAPGRDAQASVGPAKGDEQAAPGTRKAQPKQEGIEAAPQQTIEEEATGTKVEHAGQPLHVAFPVEGAPASPASLQAALPFADKAKQADSSKPLLEPRTFPIIRVVQRGDWLIKLCYEAYGFSNSRIIQWVKENNPQIMDVDSIQVGDRILFPELSANMADALHESKPKQ